MNKSPIYTSTVIHLKQLPDDSWKWGYGSASMRGVILWSKESFESSEEAINRAQDAFPNSRLKVARHSEDEL